MIEHLTRGYFGSVVNGLLHDIEGTVKGEPRQLKRGSITSRMISDIDKPGQSVADFYNKMDIADKAWQTAKGRIEAGDPASAAKVLNKYKKVLGLDAQQIRAIILTKNTSTPQSLLDMHRAHTKIVAAKKEEEDKAATEVAQAILGRDWE